MRTSKQARDITIPFLARLNNNKMSFISFIETLGKMIMFDYGVGWVHMAG